MGATLFFSRNGTVKQMHHNTHNRHNWWRIVFWCLWCFSCHCWNAYKFITFCYVDNLFLISLQTKTIKKKSKCKQRFLLHLENTKFLEGIKRKHDTLTIKIVTHNFIQSNKDKEKIWKSNNKKYILKKKHFKRTCIENKIILNKKMKFKCKYGISFLHLLTKPAGY